MPPSQLVTILGCGDIGQRLAAQLPANNRIVGLRRTATRHPRIDYRQADLGDHLSLQAQLPLHSDVIVITMTPSEYSDAGYQRAYVDTVSNLLQVLDVRETQGEGRAPRLILFVSSSSVYGQSAGEWVDEESATDPDSYSGTRLLETEALLDACSYTTSCVRFSGIYGPGRHRLIQQVRDGKGSPDLAPGVAPVYSNRIHVDDCAGVLAHLISLPVVQPLYLASDCEPSPLGEVKQWLAAAMGYGPGHLQPGAEAASRSSKRCRNQRLLDSGYRFRYPTYQQGYRQVLDLFNADRPAAQPDA